VGADVAAAVAVGPGVNAGAGVGLGCRSSPPPATGPPGRPAAGGPRHVHPCPSSLSRAYLVSVITKSPPPESTRAVTSPVAPKELTGAAGDRRDRRRFAGFMLDHLGEDDLPASGQRDGRVGTVVQGELDIDEEALVRERADLLAGRHVEHWVVPDHVVALTRSRVRAPREGTDRVVDRVKAEVDRSNRTRPSGSLSRRTMDVALNVTWTCPISYMLECAGLNQACALRLMSTLLYH
jgi:hypothetical protein